MGQENLADCYFVGNENGPDYEKAFYYFSLGAYFGRVRSLLRIGDMFKNGQFVEQNEQEAFRIYEYCLKIIDDDPELSNREDVYIRLGDCYLEGSGTDANYNFALRIFKKAEDNILIKMQDKAAQYADKFNETMEKQLRARSALLNSLDGVCCLE